MMWGGLGASEHGWQLLHMALVEARGQGCALGMRDSGSAGLRSLRLSECFGVALKVLAPGGSLTDRPRISELHGEGRKEAQTIGGPGSGVRTRHWDRVESESLERGCSGSAGGRIIRACVGSQGDSRGHEIVVPGRPTASLTEPGKSKGGASWQCGGDGELCFTLVKFKVSVGH